MTAAAYIKEEIVCPTDGTPKAKISYIVMHGKSGTSCSTKKLAERLLCAINAGCDPWNFRARSLNADLKRVGF